MAVFLNGLMWEAAAGLLKAMGLRRVNLPAFDLAWAKVLTDGLLFGSVVGGPALDTKIERLRQRLRGIGAIERRRVIFSQDLHNLCEASRCGAEIFWEKIPVDPQAREVFRLLEREPVEEALAGGEDYCLLLALREGAGDLLASGRYQQIPEPLPEEEEEYPDKPRLVFHYTRSSGGRLRLLINAINDTAEA